MTIMFILYQHQTVLYSVVIFWFFYPFSIANVFVPLTLWMHYVYVNSSPYFEKILKTRTYNVFIIGNVCISKGPHFEKNMRWLFWWLGWRYFWQDWQVLILIVSLELWRQTYLKWRHLPEFPVKIMTYTIMYTFELKFISTTTITTTTLYIQCIRY